MTDNTTERPVRLRSARQRGITIGWGVSIMALAGLAFAKLQGFELDYELIGIGALGVLGLWIVAVAVMPRKKN